MQGGLGFLEPGLNSALTLIITTIAYVLIASEQVLYPDFIDCNSHCLTKPESEWLVGGNAIRILKAPAPSPEDRSSQAAAPWFPAEDCNTRVGMRGLKFEIA